MAEDHFLVGKTITGLKIADDSKALLFLCEDGDHVAKADGDCCSETWIENVDDRVLSYPAEVLCVEDLSISKETVDEYDVVQFYGCKILTDRGEIEIDYRNSSNGYYGGDLSWPGEYFYGGVYGQNVSTESWVDIRKEDV